MSSTIDIDDFSFQHEGLRIFGTRRTVGKSKPTVLSLHGAGSSTRMRSSYLLTELADRGHSSVTLDFSGHGESEGSLSESSLELRLHQAIAACEYVGADVKVIIGSSMGAHVAATLIPHMGPQGLILFCPAAYAMEAQSVPFNEEFTEILRTPGSFKNSMAFRSVMGFSGQVRIFIGTDDQVIPEEVIEAYEVAGGTAVTVRRFIGVSHQIHAWLEEHQGERKEVIDAICRLVA